MVRYAIALCFSTILLSGAQELSLDQLFTRPYVWGTTPAEATWAKRAPVLGFLWNEKGGSFRDLYVYDAGTKKLVRLTALEAFKDPFNETEPEKDRHRKDNLAPAAGLSSFDLSEDGTKAVFAFHDDLFVVGTNGGEPRRLTKTKIPEIDPHFQPESSPDGSGVLYSQAGQVYVLHLNGGMLEQLTDIRPPAVLAGFVCSPDGRRILYSVRPGTSRTMPLPNYAGQFVIAAPFSRDVAGDVPQSLQYFVFERNGGAPRLLETGKGFGERAPQWSTDSKYLAVTSVAANYKTQEIRVVDAQTGKAVVVHRQTDERWVERSDVGWSPDSKQIWFTSDESGYQHLYTVGVDGSNSKQITKGTWEIHRDPFSRSPQWIGPAIYYSSTQEGTAQRQLYRVATDGSTPPERLSKHRGLNIAVLSEDGQQEAMLQADLKNPFDLYVNGEQVTHSPLPEFYKQPWAESRFVSYPSLKDRKPVSARLLLPPGYEPNDAKQKPRPAIVYIHGAGYATSVLEQWGSYQDLRFVFNNQLAREGYVVLEMDYRGSTGYGREWRSGVYLDMGGPDLNDVLGGVEYLKSLKNVDMARVGIWGWSYGGFMTSMALFRAPQVFRAGAAFSGVYDWENYNAVYTGERLTTPAENPEAYRRSSPINFSSQLQNPLLLVHGIVDNNVLFQDAVQLSEKLVREGKPFEEIFYPEESHAYLRDESLRDAFGRTDRFFARHLMGAK